jgi:MFS family permease
MQFVVGPLGDRRGKIRVVSLATVVCMVSALACAVAPNLAMLTLARAATGGAAAAVVPLTFAWIGDRVPFEQRQAVLARMLGATISGMIAGQWLAGVCADQIGWRAGFVVLALLFGLAALALRWHLARGLPDARATSLLSPLQQMAAVAAMPAARWLFLMVAGEGAFAFAAMAFVPTHLQQALRPVGLAGRGGAGGVRRGRPAVQPRGAMAAASPGGGDDGAGRHGGRLAGLAAARGPARLALGAAAVRRRRPGLLHAAQLAAEPGHAGGAGRRVAPRCRCSPARCSSVSRQAWPWPRGGWTASTPRCRCGSRPGACWSSDSCSRRA